MEASVLEALAIVGIAFLVAFIVAVYGFLIFIIYKMGKLTKALNRIPEEVHKELQSRYSRSTN